MSEARKNMKDSPLVSVVIPCRNRAHLLKPTIESVLQQNYPHIECIVRDGGSTDGTVEILKSYGDRIRWTSEPDAGQADAINKGWMTSGGEILTYLNADDMWIVPDAVRSAVTYLLANPEVDVVYGDCQEIDSEGRPAGMAYLHEWDLEYAVEFCDHCIPQPAAFIRKSILDKVGLFDVNHRKLDHELWLRIGLAGQIRYIPMMLAQERNTPGVSQDATIFAPACIQVTRKFFTLQNIPEAILKKKRRAFSNSYLRGVDYGWYRGRIWRIVLWYSLRAALVDPSNARRSFFQLRNRVSFAANANPLLHVFVWFLDVVAFPFKLLIRIKRLLSFSRAQ